MDGCPESRLEDDRGGGEEAPLRSASSSSQAGYLLSLSLSLFRPTEAIYGGSWADAGPHKVDRPAAT